MVAPRPSGNGGALKHRTKTRKMEPWVFENQLYIIICSISVGFLIFFLMDTKKTIILGPKLKKKKKKKKKNCLRCVL